MLSSFFGGAVRLLISPKQIEAKVREVLARSVPGFKVEFSSAKFLLSDGIWPKLGLLIENIQAIPSGDCKGVLGFKSGAVYFPVRFASLFQQRIILGQIELRSLHLREFKDHCPNDGAKAFDTHNELPTRNDARQMEKPIDVTRLKRNVRDAIDFGQKTLPDLLDKTNGRVQGILVTDLTYIRSKAQGLIRIKKLRFAVANEGAGNRGLEIDGEFYNPSETLRVNLKPVRFQMKVDSSKLSIHAESNYREGKVEAAGSLTYIGEQLSASLKLNSFPIAQIRELFDGPVSVATSDSGKGKGSWINCSISLTATAETLESSQYEIGDCNAFGGIGSIKVVQGQISFLTPASLQKLKLTFRKVAVDQFLAFLGRKPLTGIMSSSGTIDGSVEVATRNHVDLEAVASGISFYFLQGRRREDLKVASIRLSSKFDGNRWSFKLMDAQITDGKLVGDLSLDMNSEFREGFFQVNFQELRFPGSINKLYDLENANAFELIGRGLIEGGQLTNWTGSVGATEVLGVGFSIQDFRLKTDYRKANGFSGECAAKQINLESASPWFKDVKSILFLGSADLTQKFQFKNVSGNFAATSDQVIWSRWIGTEQTQGARVASDGKFDKGKREIEGQLTTDLLKLKGAIWEVKKVSNKIVIVPSARLIVRFDSPAGDAGKGPIELSDLDRIKWKDQLLDSASPLGHLKKER